MGSWEDGRLERHKEGERIKLKGKRQILITIV
jgi:hypothetical protein